MKKVIILLFACAVIVISSNLYSSSLKNQEYFNNFIAGLSPDERKWFDINITMNTAFRSPNFEEVLEKLGEEAKKLAKIINPTRKKEIAYFAEDFVRSGIKGVGKE